MAQNLQIDKTTDGDIVTLTMYGELDEASCPTLAGCLAGVCQPGARVVLDLRSLNFVDTAGIALLHDIYVKAGLEGWAFAVRTTGERYLARRAAA